MKFFRSNYLGLSLILLLLVMAIDLACTKKPVVAIHPGAISNLDSYAYDVLLADQDVINEAVAQYKAGNLPAGAKDPLNGAIGAYNLAQGAWQGYHASGGDSTALQQALNALVTAVGILQQFLNKSPAVAQPVAMTQFYFAGGAA